MIFRPLIEHHSLTNLIAGAILTGLYEPDPEFKTENPDGSRTWFHTGVEVFNPFNKRVCKMASLPKDATSGTTTMCGDLLCPYKTLSNCARWVGGSFVAAAVTLVNMREQHLCWARPNGVRLLGGHHSSKEQFYRSSKLNLFLK